MNRNKIIWAAGAGTMLAIAAGASWYFHTTRTVKRRTQEVERTMLVGDVVTLRERASRWLKDKANVEITLGEALDFLSGISKDHVPVVLDEWRKGGLKWKVILDLAKEYAPDIADTVLQAVHQEDPEP